jgi:uncharacterized Zn finger protein
VVRYYEDQWPAYVSVGERRLQGERAAAKLRKNGAVLSPVVIEGRKIAATFWGKAWCDNLESYRDYENRLERGRSYVRNGLVIDLQIAPHTVTAMVSGSSVYTVKITIDEVAKPQWKSICGDCAGGIDSLVELLQGRFSKPVMERICRQGTGLFPKPAEIKLACSCPDYATMCKHVAACLLGVGARLDARPELLFRLRGVDENDLVADLGSALPLAKHGPAAGKTLEADDMAALFGLDMADAEAVIPRVLAAKPAADLKSAAPKAAKGAKSAAPGRPTSRKSVAPNVPAGRESAVATAPRRHKPVAPNEPTSGKSVAPSLPTGRQSAVAEAPRSRKLVAPNTPTGRQSVARNAPTGREPAVAPAPTRGKLVAPNAPAGRKSAASKAPTHGTSAASRAAVREAPTRKAIQAKQPVAAERTPAVAAPPKPPAAGRMASAASL